MREKNDDPEPIATVSSPPVPPRRKSQDKLKVENKENRNSMSEAVIKVGSWLIVLLIFLVKHTRTTVIDIVILVQFIAKITFSVSSFTISI